MKSEDVVEVPPSCWFEVEWVCIGVLAWQGWKNMHGLLTSKTVDELDTLLH